MLTFILVCLVLYKLIFEHLVFVNKAYDYENISITIIILCPDTILTYLPVYLT